ncbi:DUF362 domain-containing protein [Candidatus Omnitrophota bacterium]
MEAEVALVKCKNYTPSLVEQAIRRSIELLGGIEKFVRPRSRVLLKPNLLMAKEPEFGITTHPEVVRAVARVLKGIGCELFIGDGPSVWGNQIENVDEVYKKTGIVRISEEEGIKIVKFDKSRWQGNFPLTSWLADCDSFVSLPKFKTHELTVLTAAIKNLFGLVTGAYKTELHRKYPKQEEFCGMLVDIYEQARPCLTVVDAITAMEGDGPASGGRLRSRGFLLAGVDCVALDSILALIMGLEPSDILTTKQAAGRNLGIAEVSSMRILGERLQDVTQEPFQLPSTSIIHKIPRPVIKAIAGLVRFYPEVNHHNCTLCGACIPACPEKVISINDSRISIDCSGCISCFCCQEACPYSAINVKRSLAAKLLRL